ncbi:MAG TPA: hypothetical protein VJ521_15005 [Acidobacteriota bacterium]|nr:hypothetical protein [Acidobacteriota bacterium]
MTAGIKRLTRNKVTGKEEEHYFCDDPCVVLYLAGHEDLKVVELELAELK